MAKTDRTENPADVEQMRAELALLRSLVQQQQDNLKRTEDEKKEHAKYLAWIALSAQEKTQLAADARFAGSAGDTWEVELKEHPRVRLPAHSQYEAIGRYQEICGITSTANEYQATLLTQAAAVAVA